MLQQRKRADNQYRQPEHPKRKDLSANLERVSNLLLGQLPYLAMYMPGGIDRGIAGRGDIPSSILCDLIWLWGRPGPYREFARYVVPDSPGPVFRVNEVKGHDESHHLEWHHDKRFQTR